MAEEGKRLEQEKRVLRLLMEAIGYAFRGVVAEAEAFKKAETAGLDDFGVKLKLLEAKESLLAAQIFVKDNADPLLSRLFSDFSVGKARDFDLLRNQVNNLCAELLDVEPAQRKIAIQAKEASKNMAVSLIDKLKKELNVS